MKRLVVIDGKSVFYRGYYAMPGLSIPDGTPTGGVFGFASLALEVMKQLQPDYVAVAWDKRGTSIRRRKELYPEYKAGRKRPPDDFFAQIPMLERLLEAFSWPLYECDDYEADDIMGTLARLASAQDIETCLITSDLDMLQLVGPRTQVYALKKGFSNIERFSPEYFEEKYTIKVEQFLDLKSLKGDSSDNIPGVPGIGEKTATELLHEFSTLDNIYNHLDDIKPSVSRKLEAGKKLAYLSKTLAEIWCDAPVPLDLEATDAHQLDVGAVARLFKEYAFTSLTRRLPDYMREVAAEGAEPGSVAKKQQFDAAKEIAWADTQQFDSQKPIVLYLLDDTLWLSHGKATVAQTKLSDVDVSFWRSLEFVPVVAYDLKVLYHAAHTQGSELRFDVVHDIRQAAFLIDPLERDRSIEALTSAAETDPHAVVAGLWHIYDQQRQALTDQPKLQRIAQELDFPLTYVLYQMEVRGIKINPQKLAQMSQALEEEYRELEQQIYTLVGYEFNIGSPAQLAEVLFTKLQLPTAGIKKGKTGYSTGQKELNKLRGQNPIIELIERTRELAKLQNTYVDALPKLADDKQRLHTTFNQDVASTGRLSSTNPNLQNIPIRSELGRRIREAFVPEAGNVFVSADYSQFELRLAAVLAGDKTMINDFNGDTDIHTKTAAEVYKIPMDDVTKSQRRAAKVINFGVLYGMSPHGLSAAAGMTFSDAKRFIDQYFELRAPIRAYIDATLERAKTEGFVETYYGRRRPTPDVNSSNFMVREAAKRAAANMPIQGTEADLMKRAMLRVEEKLQKVDGAKQILQIHDSILVEVPRKGAEAVSDILRDTMESIAPELNIRLKVEVSTGNDWSEV